MHVYTCVQMHAYTCMCTQIHKFDTDVICMYQILWMVPLSKRYQLFFCTGGTPSCEWDQPCCTWAYMHIGVAPASTELQNVQGVPQMIIFITMLVTCRFCLALLQHIQNHLTTLTHTVQSMTDNTLVLTLQSTVDSISAVVSSAQTSPDN